MEDLQTTFLIRENVALAPLTTLKVGGAARFFVEAKTEEEIFETISFAEGRNLPLFVLGGGSNVLISDAGFQGTVLKISLRGISIFRDETGTFVTAQAGEDWDEFVRYCVENDLQGVECLSGIPGTVGGTPVQNVGAYGQEVSESIISVRVLEKENGKIIEMSRAECGFAYRTSVFNTERADQFIVLAVTFRLEPHGQPKIVYKDLEQFFGGGGSKPTLSETRQAVRQIRAAKSMVLDEKDPNSKSAGSFFKNPIVTTEKFLEIENRAKDRGIETVPKFKVDEKNVKIPAAWLIEKSGFEKGFKLGRAGISTNHTLAIVNLGNARAKDVLALKELIQQQVLGSFGVELKPEPIFIGF
jgi:UDP-N-acetylmuramate dehydrogenase